MKDDQPKASRKRRLIFAVITLSLSILLSLSAAEIVVRLFGLSAGLENITKSVFRLTSNPVLRYEMVPFSHGSDQAINAEGRIEFRHGGRTLPYRPLDEQRRVARSSGSERPEP
jgi:hypothetical protein